MNKTYEGGAPGFDRYAWTKEPIIPQKLTFEQWWEKRNKEYLPFRLTDILKEAWEAGQVNK